MRVVDARIQRPSDIAITKGHFCPCFIFMRQIVSHVYLSFFGGNPPRRGRGVPKNCPMSEGTTLPYGQTNTEMYWRKGLHDIVGYKKQYVRQQISPKYLHMSEKSSNFASKIEIIHSLWHKTTDKQHT